MSKTLQEVQTAATTNHEDSDPCVICLETISEKAVAYPCKHESFDFLCLISWLQEKDNCPLCKSVVKYVKYDFRQGSTPKQYIPAKVTRETQPVTSRIRRSRGRYRRPYRHESQRYGPAASLDEAISRRRRVYANKLFSLHVGTNRVSQYQNLSPELFNHNERLQARAKMWIRRELQVFDFLNPTSSTYQDDGTQRRANNAEFLLEYIIAILKTVDIKGSRGQAEELISEFLGRDHTQLFLHELQAWLRSPYEKLEDWDRAVQY